MLCLKQVAAENNLSETAFVEQLRSNDESQQRFSLRWFTPTSEQVDLCGHATLGAAHALWSTGRASKRRRIDFETKASGVLSCELSESGWIQMDFPADPPNMSSSISRDDLSKALGVQPEDGEEPTLGGSRGFEAQSKSCPQSFGGRGEGVEGHPRQEHRIDFRSRFFAPRAGLAEDPVTGSAHCTLAPYWAERLGRDPNGAEVAARQKTCHWTAEVRSDPGCCSWLFDIL
eukprot:Skav225568  [mRNA]  locus=scaffold81:437617:447879:+ [translate_table: standard]